jgi:hypothetical protein
MSGVQLEGKEPRSSPTSCTRCLISGRHLSVHANQAGESEAEAP